MATTFQPVNEVQDARTDRKARAAFYTPLPLVDSIGATHVHRFMDGSRRSCSDTDCEV